MAVFVKEFVKGLWKEIPPFRLVLGICATLAVTQTPDNGLGMGIAVTFVTVFSNLLISMLRNVIPSKVRLACFIVIIATFVVVVEQVMQAYTYPLYETLGIFIPLIVVNCIILGRAEAFASKNKVLPSIADGLGMGLGFTMSLVVLGTIREILGRGTLTILGKTFIVMSHSYEPFSFVLLAPGAFICLGLLLGIMNSVGE